MTSFVLKIIACISMFIDHVGYIIYGKTSYLNYIGRIAFPIFAYQITEGYTHTKDLKKYILRLFIFALISQIPFSLFHYIINGSVWALNVMFTLLLGLICIYFHDKCPNKILSYIILFCACILAELLNSDYGYWGVLMVFVFYLFKGSKIKMVVSYFILLLVKYLPYFYAYNNYIYIKFMLFTALAIIPILLYNGKQGKKIKYFLYTFYPVHLSILYLIHILGTK